MAFDGAKPTPATRSRAGPSPPTWKASTKDGSGFNSVASTSGSSSAPNLVVSVVASGISYALILADAVRSYGAHRAQRVSLAARRGAGRSPTPLSLQAPWIGPIVGRRKSKHA